MGQYMGDIKKKSREKRIIGVAIAGVLIASLIIAGLIKKKDASKETDQITTERLQKRTIVTSVSGSGTIEATASENVTSTMTGSKVKSVEVKVGDVVTANQTIAIMDTSNLEEQKKTLNAQITALKKQEADAKKAAEDAKSALDESASSQAARNQEAINALSASITSQQAKLDADKATLQSMKDTYQSNYASTPTNADAIQYQQLILSQENLVNTEQTQLNAMQQSLATLQSGGDTSGLDLSQLTGSGSNPLTTYDGTIETLQNQVKALDDEMKKATVTTRNGGTVTAIRVNSGDTYFGTSIATIEGVDTMQVSAEIDEYDIADVAVGMPCRIKTDATRDEELEGQVTEVAIKATSGGSDLSALSGLSGTDLSSLSGGSSKATYNVKIALNQANSRLRLGMNAKVSIITNSSKDVWSVPIESVQTDDKGQKYIEVVDDKNAKEMTSPSSDKKGESKSTKEKYTKTYSGDTHLKKITVTTGLEGTYYMEIQSKELSKDDYVLVPKSDSNNSVDELMNMMGSAGGV